MRASDKQEDGTISEKGRAQVAPTVPGAPSHVAGGAIATLLTLIQLQSPIDSCPKHP